MFSCISSYAQTDSLERALSNSTDTKEIVKFHKVLAEEYSFDEPKTSLYHALAGIDMAQGESLKYKPALYNSAGDIYELFNQKDSAKYCFRSAALLGEEIAQYDAGANGYMNLGILYKNLSERDSALYYYDLAEAVLFKKDSSKLDYGLLGAIKINRAIVYEYTSAQLALEELLAVQELYIKQGLEDDLVDVYANLGMIFMKVEDFTKALEYHKKAIAIDKKNDNIKWVGYGYGELSNVYAASNELDSSLHYAFLSNDIALELSDVDQEAYTYMLLANTYYKKMEVGKSIRYSQKSLQIAYQLNSIDYISESHFNMAKCYLNKRNSSKTQFHLDSANYYIQKYKLPQKKKDILQTYINHYYSIGDISKATTKSEELNKLSISKRESERDKALYDLEKKYSVKQKENQILKLQNDTKEKELLLQKSKTRTNYLIVIFILSAVAIAYYVYYRKKEQERKLLEASIRSSEEEKIRIGKELHDGVASKLMLVIHQLEGKDDGLYQNVLSSYNDIRGLSHQLDNTIMQDELFMERILDLVPLQSDNKKFSIDISPKSLVLNEPHGTAVYRIIQELITNNLKHSTSSEVHIDIAQDEDVLTLNYLDNGVIIGDIIEGAGMKNIRDRVAYLKGNIKIESNPKLNVRIVFPINT
jgi:signal transduction histidine kinase